MNCLNSPLFRFSRLFRSYRTRDGQQPIGDESTDNICCVRVWTVLGFIFFPVSIIMMTSSHSKNNSYDLEVALAFIAGTCLAITIVLCYIFRFWWKMRARRKDAPEEETELVSDYVRDICCLPNFREEQTEPEEFVEEVVFEIVTSC